MADIEIPTRFPYLDTAGYSDERFGSAERRRMLILQNNRLAGRGQHAFHILGNSGTEPVDENGYDGDVGARGYGCPNWMQIYVPRIIQKKPGLNRCQLRIRYDYPEDGGWAAPTAPIRAARALEFQVTTRAYPFKDNANFTNHAGTVQFNRNVVSYPRASIIDLPCDPGPFETFRFFVKGGLTVELMNEATYGINNQGTADNHIWFGMSNIWLHDGGSNWGAAIVKRHYLAFDDIGGNYSIIAVGSAGGSQSLHLHPAFSGGRSITNQDYSIYDLHPWKIYSVACYFYNKER